MKKEIFKGVGTALITPFKNGAVDYDSLKNIIEKQIEAGVDALIILGTTGEPSTLLPNERKSVLEFCKKQISGRVKMIVGCGSNCTATAIKYYLQAEKIGVDGALIVTPYYNKCTQDGLIAHYKKISDAGNLPIIAYNVPSRTGVNILPETAKKLEKINNICGIKEASGNISQILQYFNQRLNIAIYSGEDSLNALFMALGGSGVISVFSNAFPKLAKKIIKYGDNKEYEKMFILQSRCYDVITSLFLEVNPIPIKACLSYMGLCANELRLPLTPMTSGNFDTLKKHINQLLENKK